MLVVHLRIDEPRVVRSWAETYAQRILKGLLIIVGVNKFTSFVKLKSDLCPTNKIRNLRFDIVTGSLTLALWVNLIQIHDKSRYTEYGRATLW